MTNHEGTGSNEREVLDDEWISLQTSSADKGEKAIQLCDRSGGIEARRGYLNVNDKVLDEVNFLHKVFAKVICKLSWIIMKHRSVNPNRTGVNLNI